MFGNVKPTLEQKTENEAARQWADISMAREELKTATSYARRMATLNMLEDVARTIRHIERERIQAKNAAAAASKQAQSLNALRQRFPVTNRETEAARRERVEDEGGGAYLGGVWTEWSK